jgi:TonB family protein
LVWGRWGRNKLRAKKWSAGQKVKVQPANPDLARKMNIAGTVKIEVVVAPNGMVKGARVVGGHPVLANAALVAARKWRFEPASAETSGVIDFKFEPR